MKKVYSISNSLLFITALFFCQIAYAQEPAPITGDVSGVIDVASNGIGLFIDVRFDKIEVFVGNRYFAHENLYGHHIVAAAPKLGVNNEDKFFVLYDNGDVLLFSVILSGNNATFQSTDAGKWNLNISSPAFTKMAGDALYILNNGYLGKSNDGGLTWAFDTMGVTASSHRITDFALDTPQNVYAADGANVYYQAASASSWTTVASFPSAQSPRSVYIDRRNRVFVGTNSNGVYHSLNNGSTWTQSTSGLTGVSCTKMCDDVFGNLYLIDQGSTNLLKSTDGGANWTHIDAPITSLFAAQSGGTIIFNSIVGDTALALATTAGLYTSTDQGATWHFMKGGSEGSLNGFYKCTNGRIVETSANGVFYLDAGDSVWHHTLPTNGYGNAGQLYEDTLGNLYLRDVRANSAAATMRSTDCGASWQADTSGIYHITANQTYWVDNAGTEYIANYSNLGGVTIYSKAPGGSYAPDTMGIGTFTGSFLYVGGFGSDGSYVYASGGLGTWPHTWRRPLAGGAWTVDTTGTMGLNFNVMIPDRNHYIIASPLFHNAGLYYRHSGTWSAIAYPVAVLSYANVTALAVDKSNGIIAAFSAYDFASNQNKGLGIYCTHDYGSTWTHVGLDSIIVNQLINEGDSTYAVTSFNGIYALTCAGVVGAPTGIAEVTALDKGFVLYPNPNNGECHIGIENFSADNNSLIIEDLTGRIVKTVALSGATTTFQTTDMDAGMYICTLMTGGKISAIKKMIVE